MKLTYLLSFLIFSCNNKETKVLSPVQKVINEETVVVKSPIQKVDNLISTWYVKKLLINGESDPENYPINNNELILNADMTAITIDPGFDMEDKGVWERVSDKQFAVIIDEEKILFNIVKLTDKELETKMFVEGVEMHVVYSKEK